MADPNPKLMGDPNKEFDPYKMLAEKYGKSSLSSAAPPPIPFGYRDWETDRKSTRLNSSHEIPSRMPSSA